jgi:hypothetical protein
MNEQSAKQPHPAAAVALPAAARQLKLRQSSRTAKAETCRDVKSPKRTVLLHLPVHVQVAQLLGAFSLVSERLQCCHALRIKKHKA